MIDEFKKDAYRKDVLKDFIKDEKVDAIVDQAELKKAEEKRKRVATLLELEREM